MIRPPSLAADYTTRSYNEPVTPSYPPMSADGTSATFTRRGAMSELNLEADISRRLAPQAASAPWASDEIASQCLATNFVAWSLTIAKSPPTRVRHRARSGSPLQLAGDPRYRLILPAKRTNAQSAFAVLQADNLNTAAIRSGPSCRRGSPQTSGRISAISLRCWRRRRRND